VSSGLRGFFCKPKCFFKFLFLSVTLPVHILGPNTGLRASGVAVSTKHRPAMWLKLDGCLREMYIINVIIMYTREV
jgi:hypothetical protein